MKFKEALKEPFRAIVSKLRSIGLKKIMTLPIAIAISACATAFIALPLIVWQVWVYAYPKPSWYGDWLLYVGFVWLVYWLWVVYAMVVEE